MPGIGHIGHLTDVEALQNRENILRPGGSRFGSNFAASVHFHFQGDGIRLGDIRDRRAFRKSENGISVFTQEYDSMNAQARALAAGFDIEKLPPEFYADPYPTYRALREHEPVKRLPNGSYFLTRYDDLVEAYKGTRAFSSDKKKEFAPEIRRFAALRAPHHEPGVQRPAGAYPRPAADHRCAVAARDRRAWRAT